MSANEREKQRFDLAIEGDQDFSTARLATTWCSRPTSSSRFATSCSAAAADFYGKLEELLKGQADQASRAAMGNAYFSLGDLTSKIGDKPAALAAHRKGLAVRRELAAAPADDAEARSDVAKSLSSTAALLHRRASRPRPSLVSKRRVTCWRAFPTLARVPTLAAPYSFRLTWGSGTCSTEIGKTDAAMAANQRSLELLTRLADENPANTEFRDLMAATTTTSALLHGSRQNGRRR